MASESNEQIEALRDELVVLLQANQPHIDLGNLQALYRKQFQKDLSLKKYGISSVKKLVAVFPDVVDIIPAGKSQLLRLKKTPNPSKVKKEEKAGKDALVKKKVVSAQDLGSPSVGAGLNSSLSFQTDVASGTSRLDRDAKLADNQVSQLSVGGPRTVLGRELVELLQSSPEGLVGLHVLTEAYLQRFKKSLNLTDCGIAKPELIADAFSDILEVVSCCDDPKHQYICNKPEGVSAHQDQGAHGQSNVDILRDELKALLKKHPEGIMLNSLSKKYTQEYHKDPPKRKVITDTYKDDFEFFSKCTTVGHQFLRLKPGLSKAGRIAVGRNARSSSPQLPPMVFSNTGLGQLGAAPGVSYSPSSAGIGRVTAVDSISELSLLGVPAVPTSPVPPMALTVGGQGIFGDYLSNFPTLPGQPKQAQTQPQKPQAEETEACHMQQERMTRESRSQPTEDFEKASTKGAVLSQQPELRFGTVDLSEQFQPQNQKPKPSITPKQQQGQLSLQQPYVLDQLQGQPHRLKTSTKQSDAIPSAQTQPQKLLASTQQQQRKQQQIQPSMGKTPRQQQVCLHPLPSQKRQSSSLRKQIPKRGDLDAAAQTLIGNIAEADQLVTVDRVVDLLKQHFQATSLQELGLQRESQLQSLNQLTRLQSKVNAFIQAFVKVRAICTLHELRESLAMVDAPRDSTDKRDYADLHLGPLSKQPLVYEFFKFPPTKDDTDIPKITTLHVLEVLNKYLTSKDLWRSKVKLENFMEYLTEEYNVEGPYDLGLRIHSVGLGISALKTAKREQKTIMDKAREDLKTSLADEVTATMEKIRKAVMSPADIAGHQFPQLELRRRYVSVTAAEAVNMVFENGYELTVYSRQLRQFWLMLKNVVTDKLSRSLFQLAICSGDLSQPDDLPEGILDYRDEEEDKESGSENEKSPVKSQPTEDQIREELLRYLDRIQHGSLNLKDLARIEAKLCQHFAFQDFVSLSRTKRTFLQFISLDHPGVLESVGGTLMGLASSSPSQGSIYRPSRMDLVEFIRQCDPCKESQDTLDICLCTHYQVNTVEELGHGPINRLSQQIIKMAARLDHQQERNAVIYETALCASNRRNESKQKEVGLYGSQSLESAIGCLASAPLLEDLAEWSHWSMVFEPEHGNLKAFLEKNPGQSLSPPIEISALEVRPGVLLRLATETSPDLFAAAAKSSDSVGAVGHLVSLVVKDGLASVPLALLSNHMETALNVLAVDSDHMIGFVLDCLVAVPLLVGQAVVRQVILNPLTTVMGSEVKSRQSILRACLNTAQRTKIQRLGFLLGISQWKDSFMDKRVPRNLDKEEDNTDLVDNQEEYDFGSLLGMERAFQTTEVKERSAAEVSSAGLPPLHDAESLEERSQTSGDRDESDEDASEVLDEEEETDEQQKDKEEHSDMSGASDEERDAKMDNQKHSDMSGASDEDRDAKVDNQEDLRGIDNAADSPADSEEISAQDEGLGSEAPPPKVEIGDETDIELEPECEVDLTLFQRSVLDCLAVVRSIRREEFGVGVELDDCTRGLMKRQQERIGRSLARLSEELYSKDTHFVLELIQNADDNEYKEGVEPSLVFLVDRSEVTVLNNEVGFSESNIRALCDVGRSTKGKHKRGYIGHKGIGFKSVFRVTDRPEITSSGYHVCFDRSSDQMGYILPTWVGPEEIQEVTQMQEPSKPWTTKITLPLKGDVQRTTSLVNKFEDIQPSLLLFLNRLRSVIIVNKEENTKSHMSRRDKGGNVVEIRHSQATDSWLLIKKCLDATKLQRVDVESTELGLAFPLSDGMSTEQNVFAFLPLRSYGFHFIIQGDFEIPSSRENVFEDSAWNQWLLQEIAPVFVNALETFKEHYRGDPVNAICQFLKFVPLESQILTDFFRKVAVNIHKRLKATSCMPVLIGSQEDDVAWKLPSETIVCPDRLVREVVPSDTLRAHLNCSHLHPQVVGSVSKALLKSLGVKTLKTTELMNILSSIALAARQREEQLSPKTVAQWLTCIYRSRDKYDVSEGVLDQLLSIPIIPLASGRVVAMEDGSVFFPLSEEDRVNQSQGQILSAYSRPLRALEQDMSTLDGRVLTSLDNVANSQVLQLLEELGVCRVSPKDVIRHHILPVIQSDQWENKSRDVMVGYVVYIKEQLEQKPDICDLEKIAECMHVLTNHGLLNARRRPVHFTVTYGNPVDLNQTLPGCDWVLLDSCYIFHNGPHQLSANEIKSWNAFFRKLGVLNYLAVEKKIVTVKVEELDVTPWADLGKFWEKPADGVYKIHDSVCREFEELVQAKLEMSTIQSQRKSLLGLLQQEWSSNYCAYIGAEVFDQSGTRLASTESSFAVHLKTNAWLPSTPVAGLPSPLVDGENEGPMIFRRPCDIFIHSDRARALLGDHVPYLVSPVQGDGGLMQFIGLKSVGMINVDFMISKLKAWCNDEGQSPDLTARTSFCTSLGHISRVYRYLEQNCRPQELRELFSDHRVVFVPQRAMSPNYEAPVPGHFVHKLKVYWQDPSHLLQKHIDSSNRVELCTLYPPDMDDFFLRSISIDSLPTIKEYAQILVQCTGDITLPDNSRIKEEVLVLYSMLGHKCVSANSSRFGQYSNPPPKPEVNSSSVQFVKSILEGQAVFPTLGNKWVTLEEKPLICDSRSTELQKLFLDKKEVNLLNFGDRNRLGGIVEGAHRSVDKQFLDVFLEACGIEMLSDCIKEEFITELTKPSLPLQMFLHDVCPYIQLYLSMQRSTKVEFQSTYEKLTSEVNIAAKMKVMRFMSAKRIGKVYRFKHNPSVFAEQNVECGLQELTELYTATGISKSLRQNSSVRREVAKLFSCGNTEVQDALFAFIGNLLLEMGSKWEGSAEKGVDENICRALGLTFPQEGDDELWEVPKPFIPEEVVAKPLKVKPAPEPKPLLSAGTLLEGDDEAAIHCWPPQSGTYGPHKVTRVGGQTKSEDAFLKMWPPPQPLFSSQASSFPPPPVGPAQAIDKLPQSGNSAVQEGATGTPVMPHSQRSQDGIVVAPSNPGQVAGVGQGGGQEDETPLCSQEPSPGGPSQLWPTQAQQGVPVTKRALDDRSETGGRVEELGEVGMTEEDSEESALVPGDEGDREDIDFEDATEGGVQAMETVDEQFRTPPQVQRTAFLAPPSSGSTKKFFLPPSTEGEAIDVEFEDLVPSPTLLQSLEGISLPSRENLDTTDIARWGEQLVYLYLLQEARKAEVEVKVQWVNQQLETGEPYDIVITRGSSSTYVEVKSTIKDQKQLVEISPKEVAFAQEKGPAFHLYRVFNAGNVTGVRLGRLQDLAFRMDRKEVQLFMYL